MRSSNNLSEAWLTMDHINHMNHFQCIDRNGDNHVQIFLQEQALDLMERNLVRTRLFFDESQNLIGFYSLFNDTIKIHKNKREEINIHLPHGVKEIPAVRLHYIGVDDRYKGQGYGDILMSSVLVNCIKIAQISGCPLITVESTESAREFYDRYDFNYVRPERNYRLMVMNTKKLLHLVN